MEFLVKTNLKTFPESIDFNFPEIKAELEQKLAYYKNLVVTEDAIKSAKADKAKLNKLAAAIEDKRKEIKAVCLAPYNGFEAKCKELVSLIKSPVVAIDTQIKEFENAKKQQKYDELKSCFDNYIGDMADIIKLDKILNPKWGNATLKLETLKAEIEDNIDRIKQELQTLNSEYAEKSYKAAVIAEYCKEYSLSKALVYAAQLNREEEMQKKVLEEKKAETAHQETVQTISIPETVQPEATEAHKSEERVGTCRFRVTCTRSQLIGLRDYMKTNGIDFEVVR